MLLRFYAGAMDAPADRASTRGQLADVLACAAVVVFGVLDAWTSVLGTELNGPRWLAGLVLISVGLLLWTRRTYPLGTATAVAGLVVAWWLVESLPPITFATTMAVMVIAYSSGRWEQRFLRSLLGLVVVVSLLAAHLLLHPSTRSVEALRAELPWTLVIVVLWLVGAYLRSRALYVEQLRAGAIREERARIARDMHDIVAHSVGMMVVQAEAGEEMLAQGHGERAASCLRSVQTTGRQALDDLRATVTSLRDVDTAWAPQPGLDGLDTLVGSVREAGLDAVLRVDGESHSVSPHVGLVAYRVVQEALTNIVRHSASTSACVQLSYRPDEVEVRVQDAGPRRTAAGSVGAGSGLVGLTERVRGLRGQVEYGPDADGGFVVVARLPLVGP